MTGMGVLGKTDSQQKQHYPNICTNDIVTIHTSHPPHHVMLKPNRNIKLSDSHNHKGIV